MRMNLSVIDPKGSAAEVEKVFRKAIVDVEKGVAFWQALAERQPPKRRASPKFVNRDNRRSLQ